MPLSAVPGPYQAPGSYTERWAKGIPAGPGSRYIKPPSSVTDDAASLLVERLEPFQPAYRLLDDVHETSRLRC
jgi:hypothetical protein